MTSFDRVSKLPTGSLINFIHVLSKNNFGDTKLLHEINKTVYNRRNQLTSIDISIIMRCLYEIDRVTPEVSYIF
jgi:hypothetical protein